RQLASIDITLKDSQQALAEIQRQRETTGILGFTTSHEIVRPYDSKVNLLTVVTEITNSGLVPVDVKRVKIQVYEGIPPSPVLQLLTRLKQSNSKSSEGTSANRSETATIQLGELVRIDADSVNWSPRSDLDYSGEQAARL